MYIRGKLILSQENKSDVCAEVHNDFLYAASARESKQELNFC